MEEWRFVCSELSECSTSVVCECLFRWVDFRCWAIQYLIGWLVQCVLVNYLCVDLFEIVLYCLICGVLWYCVMVERVVVAIVENGLFFISLLWWLLCERV